MIGINHRDKFSMITVVSKKNGMGESMIGGGIMLSQTIVFHTITNKVFNTTMI
jgi:hypothetical protein